MNTKLMQQMTDSALAGTVHFGQIVAEMTAAGVESYRTDFVRKETTYYMPNGETHVTPLYFNDHPLAFEFNSEGIQAAIRASQKGELKYIDFIPRALDAGVSGYTVFFLGKKVVYVGRKGDSHTEFFPGSKT
jgi:uncharacterized protein YbcV (DUF1398 family)